ncbi:MAG TPA: DUF4442 domain-containing protein [bacterium]|nr:DUF4442 domain-containing protein [bacterium]
MARESFRTRLARVAFNFYPAYRGSGGRIRFIAEDWREVVVEVPLRLRTRNYVGTIYGGSMYGAVDPIYMIMLIKCLGPEFLVWDKAAEIRFRKPGRRTLTARFSLQEPELDAIRVELREKPSTDRVYKIELTDPDGVVCAEVEKTVWIGRKDAKKDRGA